MGKCYVISVAHFTLFFTNYKLYYIQKTEEKQKCVKELKDWGVGGADLVKADKDTLNSLNIKNPLIQQRILDSRDIVLQNPQIVTEVMNACNDSKAKIEQIQNELQLLKKQLSNLSTNDMTQSGELNLASSWTHYGGEYKNAK